MYTNIITKCHICLTNNSEDLIIPCKCYNKSVHIDCLNQYRKNIPYITLTDHTNRLNRCEICLEHYNFSSPFNYKLQFLDYLQIISDLSLTFLFVNLLGYVIATLITLGGTANILYFCKDINVFLYILLLGSFIVHFILGIIAISISFFRIYTGLDYYPCCFIYCNDCDCDYEDNSSIYNTQGNSDYICCSLFLCFVFFGIFINFLFIYYITFRNSKCRQLSKLDNRIINNIYNK